MPYCAGVLAMGWQIRPELTKEQMVNLLFQTAYIKENGAKIINPPAFINLLLENKPAIQLSSDEFQFYANSNGLNPDPQVLSISNSGFGTLNWQISESCNWLDVNPASGTSTGPADIDEVTLTVTDISTGVHNCQLTISDPCAVNNPQTVSVTLYVADSSFGTIQHAIDSAENGDTVFVPIGIYIGEGNRDLDFNGKAITLCSIDPDDPDVVATTIIDCQGTESEPHRGFRFNNNEDANSVLNGITITGGYASFGGAILCQNSSPLISNCNFVNNFASAGGGVIENEDDSNPTLINCIFRNNSADWVAGALRNHTSSPVLINCLFTGNSALGGGAIQNENGSSNPTLINCTFTGNTASNWGGGIFNAGSEPSASPVLSNCIFWGNSDGGGIDESAQIHAGSPIINYSCIQGWTGGLGGTGNIGTDPRFADSVSGDYHLKSQTGRWDPHIYRNVDLIGDGTIDMLDFAAFASSWCQQGQAIPADLDNSGIVDLPDLKLLLDNYLMSYTLGDWVVDDVTSPCIDAGDPASDWTAELWPHGKRINMGVYGGTPQASMSLSTVGNKADLNNDGFVDAEDSALLVEMWLAEDVLLSEDINRNGVVNFADWAEFAEQWLWEE